MVVFDLNEEAGQAMVAELGADNCVFANVNVVDEASAKAGIDAAVAAFGTIHVNVNCAGIGNAAKTLGRDGPFPMDVWSKVIAVNLTGTFNVLRLCAEVMAKNDPVTDDGSRGAIINTASVAAYEGQMGQAAYSASKGGVVGMTLPIARDLMREGIRVNTILPGIFNTPLMNAVFSGSTKICEMLLALGADPSLKNSSDRTALDRARRCNKPECAALLQPVTPGA